MTHPRLILHVGGAKCGSSAFQTAMSGSDPLTAPGTPGLVYATLSSRRGLVHGTALHARARRTGFGYASSINAKELSVMDRAQRTRMVADLRALIANHDHVVLSNESWLRHYALAQKGFFEELDQPFSVFAVVRPQAEFINSGWWQWGAWRNTTLEHWAGQRLDQVQWHRHLRKWHRNPACQSVQVRLLSRDIVGDFLSAYGVTPGPGLAVGQKTNVSLPGEVLRLFQRYPQLRAGPGGAKMDFVLADHDLGRHPTPWVIGPDLAARIVEASRQDNEALCAMLPADQAARMRETPGWWSADAYAHRPLQSALPQPAELEAATEMRARLVKAQRDMGLPALPPLPQDSTATQVDMQNAGQIDILYRAALARL